MIFKRYLKDATEEAYWRSGSREFQTDEMAVKKAHDAKWEVTAGLENRGADDDWSCLEG